MITKQLPTLDEQIEFVHLKISVEDTAMPSLRIKMYSAIYQSLIGARNFMVAEERAAKHQPEKRSFWQSVKQWFAVRSLSQAERNLILRAIECKIEHETPDFETGDERAHFDHHEPQLFRDLKALHTKIHRL